MINIFIIYHNTGSNGYIIRTWGSIHECEWIKVLSFYLYNIQSSIFTIYRLHYHADRFIRYVTRGGNYLIRYPDKVGVGEDRRTGTGG